MVKGDERRPLFWICVLGLFTAAFSNAVRAGAAGAIKAAVFDPIDPRHSGAMIATVLGSSFLGFAFALLIVSPLLDRVGARRAILFAAGCYVLGPTLVLLSTQAGSWAYGLLNAAMVIWGFAWGATEGSINPVIVSLYPDDKTGRLNALHAWWPAGLILGGLLSVLFFRGLMLPWQALVGLCIVPGVILGVWGSRHEFPRTESAVRGVSFPEMIAEPFRHPGFWVFFAIMFLTASTELAPGAWVDVSLTETVGMPGILVLVYVSAIMFVMRHFAGALEHRFSDMGLLLLCTVPAALGLYLLATAASPVPALLAATLWAFGVCFMWPTMMAAVSRRYPRSGPWGIGLIGFAGAMAIYFVLPELGKIYDGAKLERAGGAEAFAALPPGSPALHAVLVHAAETSFKTVAAIPVALFFIFLAVRLVEVRRKAVAA